ncbi:hypothetical protein K0504_15740 [Neiella marina]|uniref:Lipoprotein n=1 Tax=Neiella holothuriorum TaxID=2870530 RepID=A0ABS7ELJ9_9GAMM|nr:hypothetical protein [Neiella holothuriorum]MBW8192491.1 hypothetical protein [Neiella holothuriorum]
MKHSILMLISALSLVACGGGGSESNTASAAVNSSSGGNNNGQSSGAQTQVAQTNTTDDSASDDTAASDQSSSATTDTATEDPVTSPVISADSPTVVSNSEDLTIAADFGFDHQQPLAVTIVTRRADGARYFATICAADDSQVELTADYGQCLWQATLVDDTTATNIVLPVHINRLVAELWQIQQGQYQVQRLALDIYQNSATVMF